MYCENNPLTHTDPTGLQAQIVVPAGVVAGAKETGVAEDIASNAQKAVDNLKQITPEELLATIVIIGLESIKRLLPIIPAAEQLLASRSSAKTGGASGSPGPGLSPKSTPTPPPPNISTGFKKQQFLQYSLG